MKWWWVLIVLLLVLGFWGLWQAFDSYQNRWDSASLIAGITAVSVAGLLVMALRWKGPWGR